MKTTSCNINTTYIMDRQIKHKFTYTSNIKSHTNASFVPH